MKQFDNENVDTSMSELEYLILNILRLHGREINPDFGDHGKQIYDYEELSLFTHEEIAKASREMYAKGWIYIFDDGTPYWHELLDKGRIALREHIRCRSDDMTTENIDLPRSRKPTYIKEQNNYNCQQFFGNIRDCTFVMPTSQAQNSKPKKHTATKEATKKPQPQSPMTLKYFRHGNNGVLERQRHRVDILYKKWTEWEWIDQDTRPDDFDAFFEGEPRYCNITWKANTTVLTFLLQELLKQKKYIESQTKCSAASLVKEQFGRTPNSDKKRLDKTAEERIHISLIILDITIPLPEKNGRNSNDEDISDAALYDIYEGKLRLTKGI